MVFSLPHASGAEAPQIANPIKFSRTRIAYRRPPPVLGEHTAEVLAQDLGWTVAQISALQHQGIV